MLPKITKVRVVVEEFIEKRELLMAAILVQYCHTVIIS